MTSAPGADGTSRPRPPRLRAGAVARPRAWTVDRGSTAACSSGADMRAPASPARQVRGAAAVSSAPSRRKIGSVRSSANRRRSGGAAAHSATRALRLARRTGSPGLRHASGARAGARACAGRLRDGASRAGPDRPASVTRLDARPRMSLAQRREQRIDQQQIAEPARAHHRDAPRGARAGRRRGRAVPWPQRRAPTPVGRARTEGCPPVAGPAARAPAPADIALRAGPRSAPIGGARRSLGPPRSACDAGVRPRSRG